MNHLRIKEVAEKNNLTLLEGKLNNDNLYEIQNKSTPYVSLIFQGNYA